MGVIRAGEGVWIGAEMIAAGRYRRVGPRQAEYASAILGDARAIYVIQVGTDAVKIGISNDPPSRLKALQSGQDRSLRMAWVGWLKERDAIQAEAAIHRRLRLTANYARGECYLMATDTAISFVQSTLEEVGLRWLSDETVRNQLRTVSAQRVIC